MTRADDLPSHRPHRTAQGGPRRVTLPRVLAERTRTPSSFEQLLRWLHSSFLPARIERCEADRTRQEYKQELVYTQQRKKHPAAVTMTTMSLTHDRV